MNEEPSCEDSGVIQNIKDDNLTSVCEISQKRTDCDNGDMVVRINLINDDRQHLVGLFQQNDKKAYSSHGGYGCDPETYKIIQWNYHNRTNLINNFIQGQVYCNSIGGQLFGAINGGLDEIESFLGDKNLTFLTGVKYDPEVPGFFNLNGKQKDVEVYLNSSVYEINTDNGFCICYGPRDDSAYAFSCPCEGEILRMFSCNMLIDGDVLIQVGSSEDIIIRNLNTTDPN